MCGVSHHPPLTLTPLGLASQDFRLASGTLFTLAGNILRGGGFLTAQYRSAKCGIKFRIYSKEVLNKMI